MYNTQRHTFARALPFDKGDDASIYQGVGMEQLQELIERTFRFFFDDPWNTRFRRLLLVSQYAEPRCREIFRQLYRDKCIAVQAYVFEALIEAGEIRREDPAAVAAEFHGPMFMWILTCDSFEEIQAAIREHVAQFRKNYERRDNT